MLLRSKPVCCLLLLIFVKTDLALGGERRGPQGPLDYPPRQVMLNRSMAELKKGTLYLNYPVSMPVEMPDVCRLRPEQGFIKEPWIADIPFGLFKKRGSSGEVQAQGKFIGISENEACLDLDDNGCQSGDPGLHYDGEDMELSGIREALGMTLSPGCVDLEFWGGFQPGTSGEVAFTTRVEWHGKPTTSAQILQVVGAGPVLAGIFSGQEGGLSVATDAFIANTSNFDYAAIVERWNGISGSPEGTEFFTLPPNSVRRIEFGESGSFSRGFAKMYGSNPQGVVSIAAASVFKVIRQGGQFPPAAGNLEKDAVGSPAGAGDVVLGVAGLGSPPPAGEHTLAVARSSSGSDTGVLIVNPYFRQASMLLRLFDQAGQLVAEALLELQPFTSVSRFFLEYFELEPAGSLEDFAGTLVISGDVPTSVVTLGTQDGFQQFSLPAGSNRIGPF